MSALDVSIQAQIINLLVELQEEFNLSYIFIAHDLAVVEHICDRIAVMYLGKIVEMASYKELFLNPKHPYTQALFSAIPIPDPRLKKSRILLEGDVPSPRNPPPGCSFHPRCPECFKSCNSDEPVYIKGNCIAAVGTTPMVKNSAPSDVKVIDLPGCLITPGLIEGHCHFTSIGILLQNLNFRDITSLSDCRQMVRQAVVNAKPGEWIIGRGWNENLWKENREPVKQDLDDIAPGNYLCPFPGRS